MYRGVRGWGGRSSKVRLAGWGGPPAKVRLGDSGDGYIYATGPNAGQPVTDNPLVVSTDIPPSISDIFSSFPSMPSFGPTSTPLPGVSASTLLAAAALPNAPAVVKQAAAQYSAANPLSSWFSGQMIAGIPNYLLAAAGGFILLIPLLGGKKRR